MFVDSAGSPAVVCVNWQRKLIGKSISLTLSLRVTEWPSLLGRMCLKPYQP